MAEEKPSFLKLTMDRRLYDRLGDLAQKLDYPSAAKFAVAALDEYGDLIAELMIELRARHAAIHEEQRKRLIEKLRAE